jgi:MFS family permease
MLASRFEERWLFLVGSGLTAIGLVLIPYYHGTLLLLVVLAVLSIGTGIMTPSCLSLISRYADPRQQGGILGVNQALGALGRVLGPIWGALVFQGIGTTWPFITGGIVLLLVFVLTRRTLW